VGVPSVLLARTEGVATISFFHLGLGDNVLNFTANVSQLEWTNVDMRRRVAWIDADQAKGARTISVPLSDAALEVLRKQRGKHRRLVFPYQGRAAVRYSAIAWKAACKAAGLKGFR